MSKSDSELTGRGAVRRGGGTSVSTCSAHHGENRTLPCEPCEERPALAHPVQRKRHTPHPLQTYEQGVVAADPPEKVVPMITRP
ncbi:hypothetical protein E2C01_082584 [Portunus trituberculatus]|uniref:Uncharacterized protein n=1 Tax=Portunus trituberculatus TaxID=210409 RepID=A0A5B7IUZ0_PORTR|nr:hypothetical protein [Portunus trituberculatus]